ncbi:hypothetical protein BC830DRAFT_1170309 [Chytriomyces sp. MP71]|nr:hypothetical protein BC830DRAFT_1170309 [Chytriomyces sp. MP71]
MEWTFETAPFTRGPHEAIPHDSGVVLVQSVTTNRGVKAFMAAHEQAAYTAMRTIGHTKVMNLEAHLTRVADSWIRMAASKDHANGDQRDPNHDMSIQIRIQEAVMSALRVALTSYLSEGACREGAEARVTVMLPKALMPQKPYLVQRILMHIEPHSVAAASSSRCSVTVHGPPRKFPLTKDSFWIHDRKPLEAAALTPGTNDLLLSDADGNLHEGLTSNFFVFVRDPDGSPCLITAPLSAVLNGTVLGAIQKTCERHGIRFRFQFPREAEAETWLGAFITS